MIEDAKLHLGGYTAEFGNALASVMEVTSREGNREHFKGTLGLNLTDASAVAEGPLLGGRGSMLISARRTYIDLLASKMVSGNSLLPISKELSGNMVMDLAPGHVLKMSGLVSNESMRLGNGASNPADFTSSESARLSLGSVSLQNIISKSLLFRTTLAYYRDNTLFDSFRESDDGNDFVVQSVRATSSRRILKQTAQLQLAGRHWLHLGYSVIAERTAADFQASCRLDT